MTQDLCPAALSTALLDWYRINRRSLPWRCEKGSPDPYRVWISEVMLQQTRVEAVIPYYERFLAEFPDVPALAACPEDRLMKLWEGLGYYSRARNLQKAARELTARFGGILPSDPAVLETLPGIGGYTAGAIASIAYGFPAAAVDGNVLRVLARLTAESGSVDRPSVKASLSVLAQTLAEVSGNAGALNQALMDLGACVCIPNGLPKCGQCPWHDACEARKQSIQAMLPVRTPKKPRKILQYTPLLLYADGCTALEKRTQGVLKGLWQFPMAEGALTKEEAVSLPIFAEAQILRFVSMPACMHVFTHLEWHMTPYFVLLRKQSGPFLWTTPEELDAHYPLPSAFRTCRDDLSLALRDPRNNLSL